MQPASLVDILWPYCHEPVLAVAHIRAKLHDHIRKLVEIRTCSEVLNCFILENTDFFWGETMHLYHFERLSV